MESFITYNGLALSSGGTHLLDRGSAKRIYQEVSSFMKTYTDDMPAESVQVVMHKFNILSFFKYCAHFGLPRFDWWNYWSIKKDLVYWNAWPSSLERTFPMVMADRNLLLCVKWGFIFSDPKRGGIIPNQSKLPVLDQRKSKSSLYLRISEQKKTLSAWFILPFEEVDQEKLDYLKEIQYALPFSFSAKGWRCYSKSVKGNWVPKKLVLQLQEVEPSKADAPTEVLTSVEIPLVSV